MSKGKVLNLKVFIELSSSLAFDRQSGSIDFSGKTVAEALTAFGLDPEEAYIVINNGKKCGPDYELTEGDTYKVYPSIIAG
jgi:hypothetical protein